MKKWKERLKYVCEDLRKSLDIYLLFQDTDKRISGCKVWDWQKNYYLALRL